MSHSEGRSHAGEPPDDGAAKASAAGPSVDAVSAADPPASTSRTRLEFDLGVLGDPDTNPDAHQREWRRLVEHYGPRLDGYFARRISSQADRDDLLQHIWFKAVLHVRSLPDAGVLWNWLRRVGENRVTDLARSGAIALLHEEEHAAELRHELESGSADDPYEDVDTFDAPELEGEVGRRIAALSDADRQLVMLVIERVPHEEIASRLGLPSAAASRQRWSRLRKALRG